MKKLIEKLLNSETFHLFIGMTLMELVMLTMILSVLNGQPELEMSAGLEQVLMVFEG
ncbi:MAG: hypothetical protein IME93_03760 [Proteobacteria bacterium]|nr:hypothetical protein [Pseudomonadota bacterium]